MKAIKKVQAALVATCLCAVSLPASGISSFTNNIDASAATKNISSEMEWGTLRIGGGGFVSGGIVKKCAVGEYPKSWIDRSQAA